MSAVEFTNLAAAAPAPTFALPNSSPCGTGVNCTYGQADEKWNAENHGNPLVPGGQLWLSQSEERCNTNLSQTKAMFSCQTRSEWITTPDAPLQFCPKLADQGALPRGDHFTAELTLPQPQAAPDAAEAAAIPSDAPAATSVAGPLEAMARALEDQAVNKAALAVCNRRKVIQPDSTVRWLLDSGVMLVAGYYAIMAPIRVDGMASGWSASTLAGYHTVEVVFGVFLLGEMVASALTAHMTQGWLLDDPWQCTVIYLKSWFALDLLSSFPLDLIFVWADMSQKTIGLAQLLHLLRVLQFPRLFSLPPRGILRPDKVWFKVSYLPYLKILWWIPVTTHCLTMCWTAVFRDSTDDYIHALYLVLETTSTVGYGDVTVETHGQRLFVSFLFCFSIFVNGIIVSRLTQLLVQADLSQDHDEVLQRTLAVLQRLSVPCEVQQEVISFQHHKLLTSTTSSTSSEVLNALPDSMRMHIQIFMRLGVVNTVPQFRVASPECQVALAQALVDLCVQPESDIVVEGAVGNDMYFIMHGCAKVHKNGVIFALLSGGSFFGHLALLSTRNRRTATVTTINYCSVLRLHKDSFDNIRRRFAEFSAAMEEEAQLVLVPETPEGQPHDASGNEGAPLQVELTQPTSTASDLEDSSQSIHLRQRFAHRLSVAKSVISGARFDIEEGGHTAPPASRQRSHRLLPIPGTDRRKSAVQVNRDSQLTAAVLAAQSYHHLSALRRVPTLSERSADLGPRRGTNAHGGAAGYEQSQSSRPAAQQNKELPLPGHQENHILASSMGTDASRLSIGGAHSYPSMRGRMQSTDPIAGSMHLRDPVMRILQQIQRDVAVTKELVVRVDACLEDMSAANSGMRPGRSLTGGLFPSREVTARSLGKEPTAAGSRHCLPTSRLQAAAGKVDKDQATQCTFGTSSSDPDAAHQGSSEAAESAPREGTPGSSAAGSGAAG
eukprot:TRINITY_DN9780_c0_g1_i1.p1 TRINITY_DN9780_c0_g1~~TRINITY_DN9780_c0_g1_i1.p1  ORF type:complete len:969 (+),score=151.26 TRINITY_DN9780_c0_g1_i1:66-2909(+)